MALFSARFIAGHEQTRLKPSLLLSFLSLVCKESIFSELTQIASPRLYDKYQQHTILQFGKDVRIRRVAVLVCDWTEIRAKNYVCLF